MPYADLEDGRLFYTDDGEGSVTLVLLHGTGTDSHDWNWTIPDFSKKYRVVALDHRGHGHSGVRDDYSLISLAGDVRGLARHIGLDAVVLVGHSLGAAIASKVAVEFPSLVSAIVAVDPGYGQPPQRVQAYDALYQRWLSGASKDGTELVAAVRAMSTPTTPDFLTSSVLRHWQATPLDVIWKTLAGLVFADDALFAADEKTADYLSRRACPVLTFYSGPGRADWERALFQDPRSRVIEWEGSGHYLHIERPRELVSVVTNWLESL